MSIVLKTELSKFFRTRGDFESVEMIRWILHEFGDWQTSDWLIATAKDAEDALAEWLDNYDPTPYEAPADGGNVTEENYQRAAKQKRELDR